MLFEISARINRIFPIRIMRVTAALTGASSGEMLYHGINTLFSPAVSTSFRSLKTVTVSLRHIYSQPGMLPKGISKAHPARLSGQIYLRRQSSGNSKRTIFSGSYLTKFQYLLRIKGGGQADAIGPLGNRLSCDSLIFCTGVRSMPGI